MRMAFADSANHVGIGIFKDVPRVCTMKMERLIMEELVPKILKLKRRGMVAIFP